MKSHVRNNISAQLNSLSFEERQLFSARIQKSLGELLAGETGTWAAYKNLKDEPALDWREVSPRIGWVFPKVDGPGLEFRSEARDFKNSSLGVSEPQDGEAVSLESIDGVIIPGLAFDKAGYRLGRGLGYYDRTLAGYHGKKIGVCFNISLCEELPHEGHDIPCDQIVTEDRIYQIHQSEGEKKWN